MPGEDGVSLAIYMINAAGNPIEEARTAMFNVCWAEGKLSEGEGKRGYSMNAIQNGNEK
jgi:hypothetical protein